MSAASCQYTRADADSVKQCIRIAAEAFHEDLSHHQQWLEMTGHDNYRFVAEGDEVVASLHFLDDAQRFAGKAVRSWALDNVATAPNHRNRGAGKALMLGLLREARDAGVPLSVLYASVPSFYRKVGYEPAGRSYCWQCDTRVLPAEKTGATVRRFVQRDRPTLKAIYAACHAAGHGVLARRDERFWKWRLDPPANRDRSYVYLFEFDGVAEAYASISHERRHRAGRAVDVNDSAATTVRGWRAIAAFLHGYNSINEKVCWYGSHANPLRLLIPDNAGMKYAEEFLVRIVHPDLALVQRGYPNVHCELHLDLRDESMPENAGRIVLTVRHGEPTVQRGGSGRIRLDVRALAAIYTSHATPFDMQAVELLDGPADDLAAMQVAFAGPRPYMVDHF